MNYTIQARTPEQWGRAFLNLLKQVTSLDELENLRQTHMTTARAVKKTRPDIMRTIAHEVAHKRNILLQAP